MVAHVPTAPAGGGPSRCSLILLVCAALLGGTAAGAAQKSIEHMPSAKTAAGPAASQQESAASARQSKSCPNPGGKPGSGKQIDPACDLRNLYPEAHTIGIALAIVPDPLVPRYKRNYDLAIQAIELGMLKDGYVLDRYYLPWQRKSTPTSKDTNTDTSAAPPSDTTDTAVPVPHGAFGLMTFRCDGWRGDACGYPGTPTDSNTEIRAVYVVTDIETRGVSRSSFICALNRIRGELNDPSVDNHEGCPTAYPSSLKTPDTLLLRYPANDCADARRLVILGPDFSGALDSIGELTADLHDEYAVNGVCLVPAAATDSSNAKIASRFRRVHYSRMAVTDWEKLRDIAALTKSFRMDLKGTGAGVAILAEASTFGFGVCADSMAPAIYPASAAGEDLQADASAVGELCKNSPRMYFPASIADVRYGLYRQKQASGSELATAFQSLPKEHLPLEAGAENGSEYPESSQAELTAVSVQLSLDAVLNGLRLRKPSVIVVVATEVRDRLFLFEQLREKVPRAMLIDLETDTLLSHPTFLYATRGSLALASAHVLQDDEKLFGCEKTPPGRSPARIVRSWSNDIEAILFDSVSRLYAGTPAPTPCISEGPSPERSAKAGVRRSALHVVTFHGLRQVNSPFTGEPLDDDHDVRLASIIRWTWLACLALALSWLLPLALSKPLAWSKPLMRLACIPQLLTLALFLPSVFLLAVEMGREHGNYSVLAAFVGCVMIGTWGLFSGSTQLASSAQHAQRPLAGSILSGVWAALAIVIASLLKTDVMQRQRATSHLLSSPKLTELGLDLQGGLAYYVMVAVGIFAMLYVSMAVATIYAVAGRNNRLLGSVAPRSVSGPSSTLAYPGLVVGIAVLISAAVASDLNGFFGGVRLTLFGPDASKIALLIMGATTAAAVFMTCASVGALRRTRVISAHVQSSIRDSRNAKGLRTGIPGLWQEHTHAQLAFAATPASALLRDGGDAVKNLVGKPLADWQNLLEAALSRGQDGTEIRYALYAFFATEISIFRWSVVSAVLCAMASVLVVYLFPIEADLLLLVNLAALALCGVICGYGCMVFEGDEVLSSVLCNRSKRIRLSTTLFGLIAAPFIALAIAITVIDIPGVVDWGDGILALIYALGIHP